MAELRISLSVDAARVMLGGHVFVDIDSIEADDTLRIVLAPRAAGNFQLGPVSAGDTQSNSVTVTVDPAPQNDWKPGRQVISVAGRLVPPQPYVQQAAFYTIELTHALVLASSQLESPQFEGVRVIPLPRDTGSGEPQAIWRWMLVPQSSGSLVLPLAHTAATSWQPVANVPM